MLVCFESGGKKVNIAFVILHYHTEEVTKNAVDSVLLLDGEKSIVIVDNCSPNDSGNNLQKYYSNNTRITVLLNKENLGFARGNNIGFDYAKNILKVNFIVLMNNDVVIEQKNFIQKVFEEFSKSSFYVLSPMQKGIEIDLFYIKPVDKFLKLRLILLKASYFLSCIYLAIIAKILSRIGEELLKKLYSICGFAVPKISDGNICAPLGSCMVLSSLFIEKYNGLDPRTTFYFEEWILFAKLFAKNEKSIYSSELQIFHNHNYATKAAYPDIRKRLLFIYKNFIHGLKIYMQVLKELEMEK
jgi:GT2 family glycosyltransferase